MGVDVNFSEGLFFDLGGLWVDLNFLGLNARQLFPLFVERHCDFGVSESAQCRPLLVSQVEVLLGQDTDWNLVTAIGLALLLENLGAIVHGLVAKLARQQAKICQLLGQVVGHQGLAFDHGQNTGFDLVPWLCLQLSILQKRLLSAAFAGNVGDLRRNQGVDTSLPVLVHDAHPEDVLAIGRELRIGKGLRFHAERQALVLSKKTLLGGGLLYQLLEVHDVVEAVRGWLEAFTANGELKEFVLGFGVMNELLDLRVAGLVLFGLNFGKVDLHTKFVLKF